MNIICYAFLNSEVELEAPFLNYLESYKSPTIETTRETTRQKSKRIKQISNIYTHIKYLKDHKGSYHLPPKIESYKGRQSIGIIKISEDKRLIRIAFCTINHEIILLNVIDKPKRYEKALKKKIDQSIQEFLDRAESCREDYLNNQLKIELTF